MTTTATMGLVAQAVRTPIQIGENFTGLPPMAAALEAGASDYVMLDLNRIGGVTGWQHAAGLAAAYRREVSSHLFPEGERTFADGDAGASLARKRRLGRPDLAGAASNQGRHGRHSGTSW